MNCSPINGLWARGVGATSDRSLACFDSVVACFCVKAKETPNLCHFNGAFRPSNENSTSR